MKCPYCSKNVVLTWKRYWSTPLGKHGCPECRKEFRLKHSLVYYWTIFSIAIVMGLFFPVFRNYFSLDLLPAAVVYIVSCLVILIPVDRWVDDKLRGTVKIKTEGNNIEVRND